MAIKITKEGNTKKVFEGWCEECGCEFEYEIEDVADIHYDQRVGCNYHDIKCPYCDREMWIVGKRKRD